MNISCEILAGHYDTEHLGLPAVMHWPPEGAVAEALVARKKRFIDNLEERIPIGLSWMLNHSSAKYDPDLMLPGCRSVLVSFLNYYREDGIDGAAEFSSGDESVHSMGKVARYARGRDYHKELGFRLKHITRKLNASYPDERFRSFTDIGPLDEVWLAEASGLGFRGRNGLAIIPGTGSWVVLGHILTTAVFTVSSADSSLPSCPEGCRRCIDACPGKALELTGRRNAAQCNSYLNIEHQGAVARPTRHNLANWIFGCDICQEVCPFNTVSKTTHVANFNKNYAGAAVELGEILKMKDKNDVARRFSGSPLMRAGRAKLVRNACTVAGNIQDSKMKPLLEELLMDEDVGVREHATWALERMQSD